MGEATNSAVTARGREQRRAAAQLTGRAQRDTRIAAAAALVSAAQDTIRANAERRALTVAAAELAIAGAEREERDANAAAVAQLVSAVGQLRADGLTVAAIAELLQVSVPRVRQLIRQAHTSGGPAAVPGAAGDGAG